jgi:hypothetical protein
MGSKTHFNEKKKQHPYSSKVFNIPISLQFRVAESNLRVVQTSKEMQ